MMEFTRTVTTYADRKLYRLRVHDLTNGSIIVCDVKMSTDDTDRKSIEDNFIEMENVLVSRRGS